MTNASCIGTIKSVRSTEIEGEKSYYIETNENNELFITSDSNTFPDCEKIEEGEGYLFHGSLDVTKQSFCVIELLPDYSTVKAKINEDPTRIAIQGKVAGTKFVQTAKGKDVAFLELEGLPALDVILFSEVYDKFHELLKGDKELFFIGYLDVPAPQFTITGAELLG